MNEQTSLFGENLTIPPPLYFDNADPMDVERLTGQIKRIFDLMKDGVWRSMPEIEKATGDPQASISAQLRHLRKKRFGAHTVDKRRRNPEGGLWEYRVQVNELVGMRG